MAIFSNGFKGFMLGVGVSALGYYAYKKHRLVCCMSEDENYHDIVTDPEILSLEDLLKEKERIENLIAEREMAEASGPKDYAE